MAEEGRCRRFEDGRKAAVVTAAALPPEGDPTTEVIARAEGLVLHVGRVAVRLEGPVRVLAGSREATAGSRVASLGGRVLDRIGAVDPEIAWTLSRRVGRVRLRSPRVRDRVRVAGRLQRADGPIEGAAKGYRDAGAPWCLVPDEARWGKVAALCAAFEAAPGGPPEQRATIGGAILGPLAAVVIGVLTPPPLPPPVMYVEKPRTTAAASSEPRLLPIHGPPPSRAALEDGDFAQASAEGPSGSGDLLYNAELHALAGHFEMGAANGGSGDVAEAARADRSRASWRRSSRAGRQGTPRPRSGACAELADGKGDARAQALPSGSRTQRAVCTLLLADLLPPAERTRAPRFPPPSVGEPLIRLRALLTFEAGCVPRQIPEDSRGGPDASAPIN